MNYRVVFSPEAEEQLAALYGYIATAASPDIAAWYTSGHAKAHSWQDGQLTVLIERVWLVFENANSRRARCDTVA